MSSETKSSNEAITVNRTAGYSDSLHKGLYNLQEDAELTDFMIKTADNITYKCHRAVLAAMSPMLRGMLMANMKENEQKEMLVDNIPSDILRLLLEYMYTGKFTCSPYQLRDSIIAADYLQLEDLPGRCAEKVMDTLDSHNVINWAVLAERFSLTELAGRCCDIIRMGFYHVIKEEEFLKLDTTDLKALLKKMNAELQGNEMLIAAMAWMKHDQVNRIHLGEELFSDVKVNINISSFSPDILHKYKDILLANAAVCYGVMEGFISEQMEKSNKEKIVIGGTSADIMMVDHNGDHEIIGRLEDASDSCSICSVPGGFVITGGLAEVSMMYVYASSSWIQLPALMTQRCAHSSIFCNGYVFIFGGCELYGGPPLSPTVEYCKLGSAWAEAECLPDILAQPPVAAVGKVVYVLNMDSGDKDLYETDTETRTSRTKTRVPAIVTGCLSMAAVNRNLYVVSDVGFGCYSPENDVWTHGSNFPTLSYSPATVGILIVKHGNLVMLGGENAEHERRCEEYCWETEEWTVKDTPMPTHPPFSTGFVADFEN